MQRRTAQRLILAFALLLPAVASQATAPSQADFRADLFDKARAVCANQPSQVCTTRLPSSRDPSRNGEFDPAQCPATPAPRECMVDYFPNSEIRALLTLSADDISAGVLVGALIEFQIGEKQFVINELYPPVGSIFGWNPLPDEAVVFSLAGSYASTNHGDSPIGSRLVEIAVAELGLPADAVPVVVAVDHKSPELETQQAHPPTQLASVARYRITIRFAKPAPAL